MSFRRGPVPVTVIRRPDREDKLVQITCGADPKTDGYRSSYRGTVDQVIACLESCLEAVLRVEEFGRRARDHAGDGEAILMSKSSKPGEGYIYFLATEFREFIKIGFSASVVSRVSILGTERPTGSEIRLLGCFPGTFQTEHWLHKRFEAHRDKGEWFRSCPELSLFIEGLGFGAPKRRSGRKKPVPASDQEFTFDEVAMRRIVRREAQHTLTAMMISSGRKLASAHIKAGLERSRQNGTKLGRPPKLLDGAEILQLRKDGVTIKAICLKFNLGRNTVYRFLRFTQNTVVADPT